jgi:hypothetical protein
MTMQGIQYELLAAARAGDRARFDELFDAWLTVVYGAALRRTEGRRIRAEALTSALMIGRVRSAIAAAGADQSCESTNGLGKAAAAQ